MNEISNTLGFLNGNYQIATIVNGKPSWKNNGYAIWYKPQIDVWFIGPLSEIGNYFAFLGALNNFSGITDNDNQWKYCLDVVGLSQIFFRTQNLERAY